PDAGPLREEVPILVEDLDPTVVGIGDVDAPVPIDVHGMWKVELAWSTAFDAPRLHELSSPVESDDMRIALTIRHEEAAVGQPGDVGGQVEMPIVAACDTRYTEGHDHPLAVVGELEDLLPPIVNHPNVSIGVVGVDLDAVRTASPREEVIVLRPCL